MDIEKLIESVRLCGSTPKVDQCKQCAYWSGGDMSKCIPRMTTDAATALSTIQAENAEMQQQLNEFSEFLCCMTGNLLSKTNYTAQAMIEAAEDYQQSVCDNDCYLRELAQADREGRVVVLPCKKGDVVWRIVNDANPYITKDRCTEIVLENGNVWVHLIGDRVMGGWNFGKLLFLTREEAEAALRREQE